MLTQALAYLHLHMSMSTGFVNDIIRGEDARSEWSDVGTSISHPGGTRDDATTHFDDAMQGLFVHLIILQLICIKTIGILS